MQEHRVFPEQMALPELPEQLCQRMRSGRNEETSGFNAIRRLTHLIGHRARAKTSGMSVADAFVDSAGSMSNHERARSTLEGRLELYQLVSTLASA